MGKKRTPENVSQLMLDFEAAVKQFRSASDHMINCAKALDKAGEGQAVTEAMSDARKRFRRAMAIYAIQKCGGDFRNAYTTVYDRLARRTGWHPIVSVETSDQPMLTQVERRGLLPLALQEVGTLLAGV